jgi:hypothetical protein
MRHTTAKATRTMTTSSLSHSSSFSGSSTFATCTHMRWLSALKWAM